MTIGPPAVWVYHTCTVHTLLGLGNTHVAAAEGLLSQERQPQVQKNIDIVQLRPRPQYTNKSSYPTQRTMLKRTACAYTHSDQHQNTTLLNEYAADFFRRPSPTSHKPERDSTELMHQKRHSNNSSKWSRKSGSHSTTFYMDSTHQNINLNVTQTTNRDKIISGCGCRGRYCAIRVIPEACRAVAQHEIGN